MIHLLRAVVGVVTSITALFLPAVKMVDFYHNSLWPPIKPVGDFLFEHRADGAFLLLLCLTILHFVIFVLSRYKQIDRRKIERTLDTLANRHFAKPDDEKHHYRATVFKARSLPLLGSWLGIVARNGDKYRRMRTIFSIDRENRDRNTSLAGECWWQGGTIIRSVAAFDEESEGEERERAIQSYIKDTLISRDEFDAMAVKSCVFLLTCIKIDGKKWGVLVLDSTDPEVCPSRHTVKKRTRANLEHSVAILSEMLR